MIMICFQYVATVRLKHEKNEKHSQSISKMKYYMNEHYWKGRNYLSDKDDWETLEENNPTIPLNLLYVK